MSKEIYPEVVMPECPGKKILTGQFLCAREAVREFKRRGVVKEISSSAGKIICISSVHEIIPWAGRPSNGSVFP